MKNTNPRLGFGKIRKNLIDNHIYYMYFKIGSEYLIEDKLHQRYLDIEEIFVEYKWNTFKEVW